CQEPIPIWFLTPFHSPFHSPKLLDEVGISIPSPVAAGLAVARFIAEEVVDKKITPYVGAKQIWSEIYSRFPELIQLRPFVGLASEYEDDEQHRESYSQHIVEECEA